MMFLSFDFRPVSSRLGAIHSVPSLCFALERPKNFHNNIEARKSSPNGESDMLTVHHLGISQSDRIVWLCEELGIPYEMVKYDRDRKSVV